MEAWEAVVDGYLDPTVDIATLSKVTTTAENVLKEDLASFEIEWVASSLLFEPVALLQVITECRQKSLWSKPIVDSFKVITSLVEKYPNSVTEYHADIVKTCQLDRFDAKSQAAAYDCLSACVKRSVDGVDVASYVEQLRNVNRNTTCKAPLAKLIGAICEHRPNVIEDDVSLIFRVFINMLDSQGNTSTVNCAVLRGIEPILRHYGTSRPVTELDMLYPCLVNFLETSSTTPVILEIITKHAPLFRERLSSDARMRSALWASEGWTAVRAAYKAIEAQIQPLLESEIYPRTKSHVSAEKYTALRVLCDAASHCAVCVNVCDCVHVFDLEFTLRTQQRVMEHVADAVLFCVECRLPYSDELLRTAMLCHTHLSDARMRDIITAGMKHDDDDESLAFLITESCHDGGLENYLPLWRMLLDNGSDDGSASDTGSRLVRYVARALDDYVRSEDIEMPPSLPPLLRISARIFALCQRAPLHTLSAPLYATLYKARVPTASVLLLLSMSCDEHHATHVYKNLDVERALDEESWCACAVAMLHAPHSVAPGKRLAGVQIVLSRADAEPSQLNLALLSLESLLEDKTLLDGDCLAETMRCAKKLRERSDHAGREGREFQRNLLLFLGKHWDESYSTNTESEINMVTSQLHAQLTLTVPDLVDEQDCKINLQRILPMAVENEHRASLEALTSIISSHSEIKAESALGSSLRLALGHVIRSLARLAARGEAALPQTPLIPSLAPVLMKLIATETPGPRQVLCRLLSPLLSLLQPEHLESVARQLDEMLNGTLRVKLAALDVCPYIITALSEHSLKAKEMLPRLLVSIAKTNEKSTTVPFQQASELFIDLHSEEVLNKTVLDLTKNMLNIDVNEAYKSTINMTVEFLKKLLENDAEKKKMCLNEIHVCSDPLLDGKCLYILAIMKRSFAFDQDMLSSDWNKLFRMELVGEFEREAGLVFFTQFAKILLEQHKEESIAWLRKTLASLPPSCPSLHALPACVRAIKAVLGSISTLTSLGKALEAWTEKQPFGDVAANMYGPSDAHVHSVHALTLLLHTFCPPHPAQLLCSTGAYAKGWVKPALRVYVDACDKVDLQMSYLTDVVSVGLRFSSYEDIKDVLLDPNGVHFCREFMPAFYRYLTRPPFLLCDEKMRPCHILLVDILKYASRDIKSRDTATQVQQEEDCESCDALKLTGELWSSYVEQSTILQCSKALELAVLLGATRNSTPVVWGVGALEGPDAPAELLCAVSACGDTEEMLRNYCSKLPVRLREYSGRTARVLRCVLDAAARTPSPPLLDLLDMLAAGDGTPGWWDDAMAACMTSLAVTSRCSADVIESLWSRAARHALSVGPIDRLVVPLVSNSPTSVCEEFFSRIAPELIASLKKQIPPAPSGAYHRCVVRNTRTCHMLRVMVEKVPRSSLESPSSVFHQKFGTPVEPWHAVRVSCKLCLQLLKNTRLSDCHQELEVAVQLFYQAAYATLSSLVLTWRCDPKLYKPLFDGSTWDKLIGDDPLQMPIRTKWSRGTVTTSVASGGQGGQVTGGQTLGSTRPKLFLRTLSECPFNFDLFECDEPTEGQDLVMSSSPLNSQSVSGALTSLIRQCGQYDFAREALCAALYTGRPNVRWLLTQCIINVQSSLSQYSEQLSPPLIAVLLDTCTGELNQLHLDILETITTWRAGEGTLAPPRMNEAAAVLLQHAATSEAQHHLQHVAKTLLLVARNLFQTFPRLVVDWTGMQTILDSDNKDKQEACWKVLLTAASAGADLPGLLSQILERLSDPTQRDQLTHLAKLFGAVITTRDASDAQHAWERFDNVATRVRTSNVAEYIKLLYYGKATSRKYIRHVADVAQKVPSLRTRCIAILSASLRAGEASMLADLPAELVAEIRDKCADVAFEEIFNHRPPSPPPPKQARRLTSPILETRQVSTRGDKLSSVLDRLPDREDRIYDKLDRDMGLRFVECFYICVGLRLKSPPALLALLLRKVRGSARFKQALLPTVEYAHIDQRTKATFVGTLRTLTDVRTARTARSGALQQVMLSEAALTVEQALDAFIHLGKSHPPVTAWLSAEIWRACSPTSDLSDLLADMLAHSLAEPAVLRLAVELVPMLGDVTPLLEKVSQLTETWSGTEAEPELRLLARELRLRSPTPGLFVLGTNIVEDVSMTETSEFSIEGLVQSFGCLSHWASKTLREQRRVLAALPPLWCSHQTFRQKLDSYNDEGNGWFDRMVLRYRNRGTRKPHRQAAWPLRQFTLAATTEAVEFAAGAGEAPHLLAPTLGANDCLVEWAGRLMIRCLYLEDTMEPEEAYALTRSHELAWCRSAIERGIPNSVLHAVRRNTEEELLESETLSWLCVRSRAIREEIKICDGQDLSERDRQRLQREIDTAESFGPLYFSASSVCDVIEITLLILQLRTDLNNLTNAKVDEALDVVKAALCRDNNYITACDNDRLRQIYEIAVLYYDDTWDTRDPNTSASLICRILSHATNVGCDTVIAIAMRRARGNNDSAAKMINQALSKLPSMPAGLPAITSQSTDNLDKLKRCLQLLCGAETTMMHHCATLRKANDGESWSAAFAAMTREMFENPLAGADYHALNKHRRALDCVRVYVATPEGNRQRNKTLDEIERSVSSCRRERRSVRALCDALDSDDVTAGLPLLLGVTGVLRIDDEIKVFSDAITSPGVITVHTVRGPWRYLVKRERLARDAAATVLGPVLCPGYMLPKIILLSPECGLIEYLEDHIRLRDLIKEQVDLDSLLKARHARREDELVLAAPGVVERAFGEIVSAVSPAYLRRAIQSRCSSVEDFLSKQRRFCEDLVSMTLITWLLGVGDRHLNNIMYDVTRGGVRLVDWGALFEWGGKELPLARLTPLLQAACGDDIESLLQHAMCKLRERRRAILPLLEVVLRAAGCEDQLPTISSLLSGRCLPCDVTRQHIEASNVLHKQHYLKLLDDMFRHVERKEQYTVEEQISCLLLQSTSPLALGVTRSGWEPWL